MNHYVLAKCIVIVAFSSTLVAQETKLGVKEREVPFSINGEFSDLQNGIVEVSLKRDWFFLPSVLASFQRLHFGLCFATIRDSGF